MFTEEDKKQLNQLIAVLKRAYFKDLSSAEVLTVALAIQWVSELKQKVNAPTPEVQNVPEVKNKEVKKAKKIGEK